MKKWNNTLEYYHKIRGIKMDEHDTSNETKEDPEKKYPALRFIASFYIT